MTSSLGYALMGLLARADATGYDLARRMERPVGYFWQAQHSQIYPELAKLETAKLIRHTVIEGAGPKPTKRYSLTPKGRRGMQAWLASPMQPEPVRDLETLRVYSLWMIEPGRAVDWVEGQRAAHESALADFTRQRAEVLAERGADAISPSKPMWSNLAALEGGIRSRRADIEWCDWLLEQLAAH